jgi:hypothetical protein
MNGMKLEAGQPTLNYKLDIVALDAERSRYDDVTGERRDRSVCLHGFRIPCGTPTIQVLNREERLVPDRASHSFQLICKRQ